MLGGRLLVVLVSVALARGAREREPSEASPRTRSGGGGWTTASRIGDSYLEALKHSRTSTDPREGIVATEEPAAISRIGTADREGAGDFPGVRNSYGPPRETYGPPGYDDYSPGYGPGPGPVYSPGQQGYGGAAPYGHGTPHGSAGESVSLGFPSVDFSWPVGLRLDAFTLAKIVLKLVIFKMIVKFIAIICLLLFIPKLEKKKRKKGEEDEEEDEGRRFVSAEFRPWDRLNLLTATVQAALDRHREASAADGCPGSECRGRRASRRTAEPDYEHLLRSYLLEETRRLRGDS